MKTPAADSTKAGDILDADIYPSKQAALRSVGVKYIEQIARFYDKDKKNLDITVRSINDYVGLKALLVAQFNDEFPRAALEVPTTRPEGRVQMSFTLTCEETVFQKNGVESRRGTIRVACGGNALNASRAAVYVEKPWAENFDAFVESSDNQGHVYITGRTPNPQTTPEQAYETARAAALLKLAPVVQSRLTEMGIVPDNHEVWAGVMTRLNSEPITPLQVDTFLQTFRRPYGTVYSASLLFDANGSAVQQLVGEVQIANANAAAQRYNVQMQTVRVVSSRGGAVIALCAVVGVIYLILVVMTRGYFTLPLRIGAVMMLVVGAAVVLLAIA